MGAIDTDAYVIESFALRDTCSKTEDSKTMEPLSVLSDKQYLCQCYR